MTGETVWVVLGQYADCSATKIFGVYSTEDAAAHAVGLLKSGEALYHPTVAAFKVDRGGAYKLEPPGSPRK